LFYVIKKYSIKTSYFLTILKDFSHNLFIFFFILFTIHPNKGKKKSLASYFYPFKWHKLFYFTSSIFVLLLRISFLSISLHIQTNKSSWILKWYNTR